MTRHALHQDTDAPGLEFLGHAAVRIVASGGESLLVDPYVAGGFGGKMGYDPLDQSADFVWATHAHADHSAYGEVPGDPEIIEEPGAFGPFELQTWTLAHDEYGGRRRGGLVEVTRIAVGGRTIIHLSDVGQSPPGRIPAAFRHPDILLATCGGYYTVGATQAREWAGRIGARATIPIHYKTVRCELPIRPRRNFDAHWREERGPVDSRIELGSELFSFQRVVVPINQRH